MRQQVVERARQAGPQIAEARRPLEEDLGEHRHHVRALEDRTPGEALEEHAAERIDVRAPVDVRRPARLLGRHVAGRADDRARDGARAAVALEPRRAEVEQRRPLDRAALEPHVRRLDVAVHDPERVRRRQSARHARRHRERVPGRERSAREPRREVLAVEPLHGEPGSSIRRSAVRDVPHDRRVIERGDEARLPLEAGDVTRRERVQQLERHHCAAPLTVARAQDRPHAARARDALDLEAPADDAARCHHAAQCSSDRRPPPRAQLLLVLLHVHVLVHVLVLVLDQEPIARPAPPGAVTARDLVRKGDLFAFRNRDGSSRSTSAGTRTWRCTSRSRSDEKIRGQGW